MRRSGEVKRGEVRWVKETTKSGGAALLKSGLGCFANRINSAKSHSRGLHVRWGTGCTWKCLCQSRVGRTWASARTQSRSEGSSQSLCVPTAPAQGCVFTAFTGTAQIILSLEITLVFINPDRLWWNYASLQLNSQQNGQTIPPPQSFPPYS